MQRRHLTAELSNDGDTNRIYEHDDEIKENIPIPRAEQQLDAAQRVLETLDAQINYLDKLQQRIFSTGSDTNTTAQQQHQQQQQQQQQQQFQQAKPLVLPSHHQSDHHRRALLRAIEERKLALDYYVERGLRGATSGEAVEQVCECRFEHHSGTSISVSDCSYQRQQPVLDCQRGEELSSAEFSLADVESLSNADDLLDYIEQQQQHPSFTNEQQLFIDEQQERGILCSRVVPQGCASGSRGCCGQVDADANDDEAGKNLYEIEREYSRRLTGFKVAKPAPRRTASDIGNALVDESGSNCPSSSSSSADCDDLPRHASSGRVGRELAESRGNLTDDNNNCYSSASSSSLSLSWSQDFLQTLANHLSSSEEEEDAQLINSILRKTYSEGNIDFPLCETTNNYNGSIPPQPQPTRHAEKPHRRHSSGSISSSELVSAAKIGSLARGEPASIHDQRLQHNLQQQQHGGAKLGATNSMRAVRDLAKMSAPSLSALQYLPSHLDLAVTRRSNKMSDREKKNQEEAEKFEVIEETASVKHDDSCLFHRLCMCSCVARQNSQHRLAAAEPPNSSAAADRAAQGSRIFSTKSSSRRQRSKSSSAATNEDEQGEDEDDKDERSLSKQLSGSSHSAAAATETEKQSPRFLNLLLLRPSSPSKQKKHPASEDAPVEPSGGKLIRQQAISGGGGGGGEDATDSDSTRAASVTSSFLQRNRSPSSLSSSAISSSATSRHSREEGDDFEDDFRSKSACSNRDDDARKSSKSYKRFLSPKRIFSSSPSSSKSRSKSARGLESLVEQELLTASKSTDSEELRPKSRSSFLSRSLTKLTSQRAAKSLIAKQKQQEDLEPPRSASPPISISESSQSITSNTKQQQQTYLTSTAPQIVLNMVELINRRSCDEDQDSISRNSSIGPRVRNASMRHLDASSTCGEESLAGDRACSLPPSPRRYRRQRAAGGNRSPRLAESPVVFKSPAAMSTKIEDGLKVCSTEHFEKHIDNVKGSQDDAQSKLFRAWINHFHPNLIRHDLVEELRDGIKLIGLLASLTRDKELRAIYEKLSNDKQSYVNRLVTTPSSRLRHLSNVSIAIDYLRQKRHMKLVNLNPMDIVSGKPNTILGLCWNIILNFQLEQPPSTSRLSQANRTTNEDGSRATSSSPTKTTKLKQTTLPLRSSSALSTTTISSSKHSTASLIEEYGTNDLIAAKRKLLERINQRFNLKLTNLTSNLLDGDVLLAIIKRLVPDLKREEVDLSSGRDGWSNEEKLDCCFDVAETHLGIPRLFDASDLKMSPQADGTKSSLIYLSMLLNAEQAIDHNDEPALEESEDQVDEPQVVPNQLSRIESCLDELEKEDDKFEIGQLDETLNKIRNLEKLVHEREDIRAEAANNNNNQEQQLDDKVLDRCQRLREQANQIEALIKWINEADNLLEGGQQKSAKDLTESIERYRQFFSPDNLPKLETSLCPTLERQYRECLSSAKQKVLFMEQTLKNWISYEESRKQLKLWLLTSEAKLSNALNPPPITPEETSTPLALHSERLNDLIEYFELEDVDDDNLMLHQHQQFTSEQLPLGLSMMDHQHDSASMSGSLISLGSTSSRMSSSLQSSKKASYHKLFDDFELKCRLLAAMLDRDQRESLLLGVRELRHRLRCITEQRVPQVITELRMSISRCEMSIQERDEEQLGEVEEPTGDGIPSEQEARSQSDAEESDSAIFNDSERSNSKRASPDESSEKNLDDCRLASEEAAKSIEESLIQPAIVAPATTVAKPTANNKAKQQHANSRRSPKSRKPKRRTKAAAAKSPAKEQPVNSEDDVNLSVARRIWKKLVRAFKTSLPLNIVLLVCLAGLCVVPMIQKDACCGLAQQQFAKTSDDIKPV